MQEKQVLLMGLTWKTIVAHTITYFVMGALAFTIFNYASQYAQPELRTYMRQTSDPIVALGPALQPIRGQLGGGLLEILTQSFLFSGLLYYWVNHPGKRWLNWVLGTFFGLVVLMSGMGFLAASGLQP